MILYEWARKVNHKRKAMLKERQSRILSPVRRIERVHPIPGERLCAMTFDDGPMNLPPCPDVSGGVPLTQYLADTLMRYGCRATFDVVGDTGENYPDEPGEKDGFYWGGVKWDHYPAFGQDAFGGAKNCPELIDYLLKNGFELSNHGYQHRIFGPSAVYRKRVPMADFPAVETDLRRLHACIAEQHDYTMKLSRPPHYIDGIPGGYDSYDAYDLLGYHYMAASFDGKGWMPEKESYEQDVEGMVAPLRAALEADPEALNGQIIFQKDGCNMSGKTPIASALPLQLELLREYGYTVVSVGELLRRSRFEDLSPDDPCYAAAAALDEARIPVAFRTNVFRRDDPFTFEQLCLALFPREKRHDAVRAGGGKNGMRAARDWAAGLGVRESAKAPVTGTVFAALLQAAGYAADVPEQAQFTRGDAVQILAQAMLKN